MSSESQRGGRRARSPEDMSRYIREVQRETAEWREQTINGDTTPMSQAAHTSVEASEVLDELVKSETYEDADELPEATLDALRTECGDVIVAHLGTMSLLGLDVVECIEAALEKNGARDWAGWQGVARGD